MAINLVMRGALYCHLWLALSFEHLGKNVSYCIVVANTHAHFCCSANACASGVSVTMKAALVFSLLPLQATLSAAPTCGLTDAADDCAALQAVYASTGAVLPWPTPGSSSLCDWDGVACNAAGRVRSLDLHNQLVRPCVYKKISLRKLFRASLH